MNTESGITAKAKRTKPIIEISSSYGFDHNWTLVLPSGKSFYLGQDVKFCSRVLGMEPSYIAKQIGSSDLRPEKTRRKLAQFIIDSLNLDTKQLKALQPWELCCQ